MHALQQLATIILMKISKFIINMIMDSNTPQSHIIKILYTNRMKKKRERMNERDDDVNITVESADTIRKMCAH